MGETENKLLTFIETPVFVEQLEELAGGKQLELLYAIQNDLLTDSTSANRRIWMPGREKCWLCWQTESKRPQRGNDEEGKLRATQEINGTGARL